MALLNIFKKGKKERKKEKRRRVEKTPEFKVEKSKGPAKIEKTPVKKEETGQRSSGPKKNSNIAYRILKEPHVTEKATDLVKNNQYVFKIWTRANKVETKKAIEDLYKVNVVSVRTIKVSPKKRRLGRIEGWRKGYKKAIVKLKKGQKIELLPR